MKDLSPNLILWPNVCWEKRISDHYKLIFMDSARILVAPIGLESLLIIHTPLCISYMIVIQKEQTCEQG